MIDAGTDTFNIEYDALDDSGLWVELVTGADFGCLHHPDNCSTGTDVDSGT